MTHKDHFLENALENILVPAQKSDLQISTPANNLNEFLSTSDQLLAETAGIENPSTNMSIWLSQIDASIEQDAILDDSNIDDIDDLFADLRMDAF